MPFVCNLGLAFDEVVRRQPERSALIYAASGARVSYGELDALAARIAAALWARGLRPGGVLALLHDKSPAAYATMLACLRLGVPYANLDPDSPWERVRRILDTCRPRLVVNPFPELAFAGALHAAGHDCVPLRELEGGADADLPALDAVAGGTPAYVMFTSGSTGQPKGAVMSHANLLWFVAWARERFAIGADDVLTGANPAYFDNSVFDVYAALFSGAALAPFSAAEVREPRRLVQLVDSAGCTSWFSVPSLLVYLLTTRALDAKSFAAVRRIVFGGEGFPKAKLKQLFDLFGARARLENVYGPTECTCICSAHTIGTDDFADMRSLAPLGRLAENFDYEILPLDAGDADFGELFLRGPQVGLGYYADPVRTAQSFVQNPRHALYADIGYRTGDLVRRDARGWLHFAGRADFQVKHMGYRIELEEVEAALNALPGVRECGVVYQPLGDGLGQILAFAATAAPADPAELLVAMARLLPHYMMPRRLVLLDALPKNANGKIDRPALLAGVVAA